MYGIVVEHTYKESNLKDTFTVVKHWFMPTLEQCTQYATYWGNKHGAIGTIITAQGTIEDVKDALLQKGIIGEKETE